MASAKGLGKGLGALLGEITTEAAPGAVSTLPLQKIEPNPDQPRRRFDPEELQTLADSIAAHGVIQPLAVRETPSGYYQIIAGERRWRAARMAGLQEIPAVVLEADDRTVMELALIENLQRADLNPIEEAQGYRSLMEEYHLTQEQAAEAVGKSRPAVANAMRLLALPQAILEMVESGKLSAGHARAILQIKNEREQLQAAQKIAALDLSVRQAELMCKRIARADRPPQEHKQPSVDYIAACERQLSHRLGRGVKIEMGRRKGRLNLEFYGQDDLQVLLDALQKLEATHGKRREKK